MWRKGRDRSEGKDLEQESGLGGRKVTALRRPADPLPWTLRGSEHPQRGCAASSVLAFQRVRVSIIRPSEGGSEGLPWLRG